MLTLTPTKTKVLIIHHLESMWESGYERMGTSFEEMLEKVVEYLSENEFDHVILTRFEEVELEDEHHHSGLAAYVHQVHDYAYGWEYEGIPEEYQDQYVEGGNHSERVYVAEWMHELTGDDVTICGAFDGECIEDLEIALGSLDIDFDRIEELIV